MYTVRIHLCGAQITPHRRYRQALIVQIALDQHLQQLVAVDFPNQTARIVVRSDIGRILRQNIADDLINGIIPF